MKPHDSAALPTAIAMVESGLAAADQLVGPYSEDPRHFHERHRQAMNLLIDRLVTRLEARVNDKWDGARVRIAGITASSTTGMAGSLHNWLKSARANVADHA